MKTMMISILMMMLCMASTAAGCIDGTDIQTIADATGTQYILWDDIFSYYCDSMDDMDLHIDGNDAAIHKLNNDTHATIDSYLILNNLTADHYINLSNHTMDSYLRLNDITMAGHLNLFNLSLDHHINMTDIKINNMNRTLHNMTNRTEHLYDLTLMQSGNILDEYRSISDTADREIMDQTDSQLSRLRSDKVSYSQLNNLSESIKLDVYKIVNNNKTSPVSYYLLILINVVLTVILILIMVPRLGGMGMTQQQQPTGTDYASPPKTLFRSLIPTKMSSIPSIVVTNENIVNQKKLLRNLKYDALKLAAKDTNEFKKELMKDIDDNMIKDTGELNDHYTKFKLIHDEGKKEQSTDNPRIRISKTTDAGQQQALP